ncbi:MAG: glycine zipper 2TM domain-containing protein [Betaproteobacteria bacterium]|nr:glycine zipper 2TM domain-containing protein [Betaproteobacteria bacterium]
METRNGILYPTMVIAAITVILFSVVGIATMTGLLPSAISKSDSAAAAKPARSRVAAGNACTHCGVVESIRAVEVKGSGSGLGAAAGGVVGGMLGNQIGGGSGRTAMTIIGAAGGALAGNEIEKNMNRSIRYQVRVRMNDGSYRTFYEAAQPALAVGQKVRVVNGGVIAAG